MSAPGAVEPVVVLRVARETYGIPVSAVREVLRDLPLLPAEPGQALLVGVAEVEGERLPVVDLARRLGADPAGAGGRLLVVVHPAAGAVALRVDAAAEVRDIDPAAVEPVPDFFGGRPRGVRGLVRLEQETMVLLDVPDLLSAEEAEVITRAAAPAPDRAGPGHP